MCCLSQIQIFHEVGKTFARVQYRRSPAIPGDGKGDPSISPSPGLTVSPALCHSSQSIYSSLGSWKQV